MLFQYNGSTPSATCPGAWDKASPLQTWTTGDPHLHAYVSLGEGRPGTGAWQPRASSSELCTQISHLCVSSGGPLGDGRFGRFSRSTGSPSWPSPGSCREAARAAGRRQISSLLANVCSGGEMFSHHFSTCQKLFAPKLLTPHKVKHVNTTPVYFIL